MVAAVGGLNPTCGWLLTHVNGGHDLQAHIRKLASHDHVPSVLEPGPLGEDVSMLQY